MARPAVARISPRRLGDVVHSNAGGEEAIVGTIGLDGPVPQPAPTVLLGARVGRGDVRAVPSLGRHAYARILPRCPRARSPRRRTGPGPRPARAPSTRCAARRTRSGARTERARWVACGQHGALPVALRCPLHRSRCRRRACNDPRLARPFTAPGVSAERLTADLVPRRGWAEARPGAPAAMAAARRRSPCGARPHPLRDR